MLNTRDGGVNGVKLTCEECETEYNNAPRRRVLRALEEEGRRPAPRSFIRCRRASRTRCIDKVDRRQDPDDLDRLRAHRTPPTAACFPYVFPLDHELLVAEHGQDQVHRHEGRRDGQAEGQEDREHLSRLGVRQGDDPDPRRAGEEVRLHGHAHRGARIPATSRVRNGCRSARSKPDLGHPARLGRDESGRAEDRRRRSAIRAITSSASGGRAPRKTRFRPATPAKGFIAAGVQRRRARTSR